MERRMKRPAGRGAGRGRPPRRRRRAARRRSRGRRRRVARDRGAAGDRDRAAGDGGHRRGPPRSRGERAEAGREGRAGGRGGRPRPGPRSSCGSSPTGSGSRPSAARSASRRPARTRSRPAPAAPSARHRPPPRRPPRSGCGASRAAVDRPATAPSSAGQPRPRRMREVRIRDTLSGEPRVLDPNDEVGIYACGPTVYSRIHIGNARPFRRLLALRPLPELEGYRPRLVVNVTDVNDKIYTAAAAAGEPSGEFAARDDRRLLRGHRSARARAPRRRAAARPRRSPASSP